MGPEPLSESFERKFCFLLWSFDGLRGAGSAARAGRADRAGPTELGPFGAGGLGVGIVGHGDWFRNWAAIFSHTFNENSKLMKV